MAYSWMLCVAYNLESNKEVITMTENEAIEMFEERLGLDVIEYVPEYAEGLRTAITALKEIQQYREIGTVEECREAVEKQRTKKIIIRDWNPTKCPTCGHELSTSLGDGYYKHPIFLERCPECGQAIQWDNLEGMEDEKIKSW